MRCQRCGKETPAFRWGRRVKYCSRACVRVPRPGPPPAVNCRVCGVSFQPRRRAANFLCSAACRKAHDAAYNTAYKRTWRQRRKEGNP